MRIHRFYLNIPINGSKFDIPDRDMVHQWRSVFRYNVGSQVILFDGSGTDFLCMITHLTNSSAAVEVVEELPGGEKPKREVTLCMALIKKDNFELVAEKATELGVTRIIPVLCERSEKKNLNMDRLRKIVTEASEQSGRGNVPAMGEIVDLQELLQEGDLPNKKLVMHLDGEYISDLLGEDGEEMAIFIGPEGGWSDNEIKVFETFGVSAVSLGSQVLRAETAAISSLSLLLI